MKNTPAPKSAPVTGWDRTVVVALGLAASALSYDAIQQMAVAIHIRGFLTYLMPLVIDGFIAYGVRGLLVLRDAPLKARAYVWILFGTATAASLWANALHAVRLNQLHAAGGGLRLGDSVVAVLSTIAPLALAGAVHLYILIARRPAGPADRAAEADRTQDAVRTTRTAGQGNEGDRPSVTTSGQLPTLTDSVSLAKSGHSGGQPTGAVPVSGQSVSVATVIPGSVSPAKAGRPGGKLTGAAPVSGQRATVASVTPGPVSPVKAGDLAGQPSSPSPVSGRAVTGAPVTLGPVSLSKSGHPAGQPTITRQVSGWTTSERRSDPDTDELMAIAREAVRAEDKLTRKVVAEAIRGQKIPLSSNTLTQLMAELREQHRQPVTAARN